MKEANEQARLVFEESDVFTAQKYLRSLADGRNPIDGEDLPEDGLLQEEALKNALDLAADLLDGWLKNGGFNTTLPGRVRPFELSASDREKIEISRTAIGVTTLANNIAKVLPYDMQTVRYTNILNWLMYVGALEWRSQPDGQRKRFATDLGNSFGITVVERKSADGSTYLKNVYDENAQRFILDNLEGIMSYHAQAKVQEAAEIVEMSKEEREALEQRFAELGSENAKKAKDQ